MKLAALATMTLSLFALAVLTGCDQANEPEKEDNTNTLPAVLTQSTATAATAENIVGTWRSNFTGRGESTEKGSYSTEEEETYILNSESSYIKYNKKKCTSKTDASTIWYENSAEKGTYSLNGSVITWTKTHFIPNKETLFDPLTIAETEWSTTTNIRVESIALIDGKLCPNAYSRESEGTGLAGTWIKTSSSSYNPPAVDYYKYEFIISEKNLTQNSYRSDTGTFDDLDDTDVFEYSLPGNNILNLLYNGQLLEAAPVLFSDEWMAIGAYNIYTKVTP